MECKVHPVLQHTGLIAELCFRFLWVDWQLRELCKLLREWDIRARLGRLPKGLTGVYDEIITSIKSQPDCNFDLAIRALQWMLVSEGPLEPTVLVAAAQVNPHVPVNGSAPSQESTLAVELLIQSCEGLLLLYTTWYPDVVRFSHLSVQEYLETGNEIWDIGIIDAQLFVSETCLWALQYGHGPGSPLYEYAAGNWFKHCRSYQDLVLSAGGTKHQLCVPLLNMFLGSFKQASASYITWVDWVGEFSQYDDRSPYCVRSTPLCPAFSAAFAGLGELVGGLWDSEENEINTRNYFGDSLLDIAS